MEEESRYFRDHPGVPRPLPGLEPDNVSDEQVQPATEKPAATPKPNMPESEKIFEMEPLEQPPNQPRKRQFRRTGESGPSDKRREKDPF